MKKAIILWKEKPEICKLLDKPSYLSYISWSEKQPINTEEIKKAISSACKYHNSQTKSYYPHTTEMHYSEITNNTSILGEENIFDG